MVSRASSTLFFSVICVHLLLVIAIAARPLSAGDGEERSSSIYKPWWEKGSYQLMVSISADPEFFNDASSIGDGILDDDKDDDAEDDKVLLNSMDDPEFFNDPQF
eukprot:c11103_g1_i1 orf=35-349(-)